MKYLFLFFLIQSHYPLNSESLASEIPPFQKEDYLGFEDVESYALECQEAAQDFLKMDLNESNAFLEKAILFAKENYVFSYQDKKLVLPHAFISHLKDKVKIELAPHPTPTEKDQSLDSLKVANFNSQERKITLFITNPAVTLSELKIDAALFKSLYHEFWHAYYVLALSAADKIKIEKEWDLTFGHDSEGLPRAMLNDAYEGEYTAEAFHFLNEYAEKTCPGLFDRLNDSGMVGNEAFGYFTEGLVDLYGSKNPENALSSQTKEFIQKLLKGQELYISFLSLTGSIHEERVGLSSSLVTWFDEVIFENQIQLLSSFTETP